MSDDRAVERRRWRRSCFGYLCTVAILGGVAALLVWKRKDVPGLELNEWGDLIAGVSAALAFVWILVGYWQQNEELRIQVEELKQSVEAQQKQATATEESLEIAKARIRREANERREGSTPRVRFAGTQTSVEWAAVTVDNLTREQVECSVAVVDGSITLPPHKGKGIRKGTPVEFPIPLRTRDGFNSATIAPNGEAEFLVAKTEGYPSVGQTKVDPEGTLRLLLEVTPTNGRPERRGATLEFNQNGISLTLDAPEP